MGSELIFVLYMSVVLSMFDSLLMFLLNNVLILKSLNKTNLLNVLLIKIFVLDFFRII